MRKTLCLTTYLKPFSLTQLLLGSLSGIPGESSPCAPAQALLKHHTLLCSAEAPLCLGGENGLGFLLSPGLAGSDLRGQQEGSVPSQSRDSTTSYQRTSLAETRGRVTERLLLCLSTCLGMARTGFAPADSQTSQ